MPGRTRRFLLVLASLYLTAGTIALALRLIGGDFSLRDLLLVGNMAVAAWFVWTFRRPTAV